MNRALCLLTVALLFVSGASAAPSAGLDVASLRLGNAVVGGPILALDVSGYVPASFSLEAAALTMEVDWSTGTYAGPFAAEDDSGQDRHELGPAELRGTSQATAPRLLIVALTPAAMMDGTVRAAVARASTLAPSLEPLVASSQHGTVTADVAGATAWTLADGTMELQGSFLLVAWSWDLEARSPAGAFSFGTGERRTPAAPDVTDLVGSTSSRQLYATAHDARITLVLQGSATAHLAHAAASWDGAGILRDPRGELPDAGTVDPATGAIDVGPGSLTNAHAEAGRLLVDLRASAADPPQPQAVAGMPVLGNGPLVLWALPLAALALLVPGAGVPLLRRLHGRRLAEAEAALAERRFTVAADLARRLSGSRWFAMDAAVLGAEASLLAGDPRQALAFLEGRSWSPQAQAMRGLLRARALAMCGDLAAAGSQLESALRAGPDLAGQARRDPRLRRLLDGAPEAYA